MGLGVAVHNFEAGDLSMTAFIGILNANNSINICIGLLDDFWQMVYFNGRIVEIYLSKKDDRRLKYIVKSQKKSASCKIGTLKFKWKHKEWKIWCISEWWIFLNLNLNENLYFSKYLNGRCIYAFEFFGKYDNLTIFKTSQVRKLWKYK